MLSKQQPCLESSALVKTKKKREGKLVHVIRHGQAQHNVDVRFLAKRDTKLTFHGRVQARGLRHVLSRLKPEVAVTSAVLRALQTTRAMGYRCPTVVVPDARELGGHVANAPVDPRRAVCGDLQREFGKFDWSLPLTEAKARRTIACSPQGMGQKQRWEPVTDIRRRAQRLTRYLSRRPERCIALVSHGEFLMELTGDKYMGNCELRTYRVVNGKWLRVRRREDRGEPAKTA
jgi:broad specificity phosphatase PhoE|eukprot:TRINITY_DN49703_c0_g1_i1.p1 TRINITY_DN49703_c0_g1~~TRINITY_DN49703_c0_g1_i1.p1  ORF type:complete len:232 (-),score=38.29 TRINITY_DN49703_c0_g1_i1:181-876(-)